MPVGGDYEKSWPPLYLGLVWFVHVCATCGVQQSKPTADTSCYQGSEVFSIFSSSCGPFRGPGISAWNVAIEHGGLTGTRITRIPGRYHMRRIYGGDREDHQQQVLQMDNQSRWAEGKAQSQHVALLPKAVSTVHHARLKCASQSGMRPLRT